MGDVGDYLARLDWAVERDWLAEQLAFLGHSRERVGAGLALAVANGLAGSRFMEDGTWIIWPNGKHS